MNHSALPALDILSAGRIVARKRMPYFGTAIMSMIPKEAPGLNTIGVTDRWVMLYDPLFVQSMTVEQMATVVLHEVMHLLRCHQARKKNIADVDNLIWNIACDAEINDDLVNHWAFPDDVEPVTPDKIGEADGLTAEEYYRALMKKAKPSFKIGLGSGKCGSCAGNPVDAEAEAKANDECGRAENESKRIERTTAEAIRDHASKSRGTVPGGWQKWADSALGQAKIPWQQKLRQIVRRACAYRHGAVDYSFSRMSRRQPALGFGPGVPVVPGLVAYRPNVAVVVDTSGSMGEEETRDALNETDGVIRAVGGDVTFVACDAAVHELKPIRNVAEAIKLLKGGGGTDFCPAFEALMATRRRPELIVFMTDGYGTAPKDAPACHTIWCLIGGNKKAPAKWGDTVVVE